MHASGDTVRHTVTSRLTPFWLSALQFAPTEGDRHEPDPPHAPREPTRCAATLGGCSRLRWEVVGVPVSLLVVVVDCRDPLRQAEFWAQALTYNVTQRNPDEFQVSDPTGTGGSLYFMKVPEPKVGKNRLHLDLVTSGPMEAEVTRLVEAGAQMVEVRQDPASYDNPDTWTVMRDPEGNEFCVTSTATLTGWA